jgi:CCDC81-like prokaryotic HU domain 1/CCDC81-like prokaryotic HU domain 2/SPOR domain
MQGFEDTIIQLLLRHNCVVVPGFGGFVAKQVAAELDFNKGLISPPKKALLFNRFLLADDGLFLAEYARQYGLYYDDAKTKLTLHTDALQRQLLSGETIKLAKLGTFSRQTDGQISFEQDSFFNLLLSSYGLNQLHFVSKPIEIKEEERIIELKPNQTESKMKWSKVAAAACLLPLAFYSFWIPTQTNALQSGLFSSTDFNPMHHQVAPAYQKSSLTLRKILPRTTSNLEFEATNKFQVLPYEWQTGYPLYVAIPAQPKANNLNPTTSSTHIESFTPTETTSPYDFIVGCFSNLQNAQNLKLKLERDGFSARLIQNGPLTKVSAGAAQNLSELQHIQQQATARGLQGWVLNN